MTNAPRASLDAIRIREQSNLHSQSLEDRIQDNLNQFYRLVVMFGLVVAAIRLTYQAVQLASLSHSILLLFALGAIVYMGNQINKAASAKKQRQYFNHLNSTCVTYTTKTKADS